MVVPFNPWMMLSFKEEGGDVTLCSSLLLLPSSGVEEGEVEASSVLGRRLSMSTMVDEYVVAINESLLVGQQQGTRNPSTAACRRLDFADVEQ